MPGLLEGDRALVTGAGRGIGRAMAEAIEHEGAQVFRADLAEGDLTTAEGAAKLAEEAMRKLGSVSIFVHCASPQRQEAQTAMQVTWEQWRAMLSVNLDAAFVIAQKLGRHMVEKKDQGPHADHHLLARASRRATCRTTAPPRPGRPCW